MDQIFEISISPLRIVFPDHFLFHPLKGARSALSRIPRVKFVFARTFYFGFRIPASVCTGMRVDSSIKAVLHLLKYKLEKLWRTSLSLW